MQIIVDIPDDQATELLTSYGALHGLHIPEGAGPELATKMRCEFFARHVADTLRGCHARHMADRAHQEHLDRAGRCDIRVGFRPGTGGE